MERFMDMVQACTPEVTEIMPWDLVERMQQAGPLLLDIREPYEFSAMHIKRALNVPRGILETACEYGYEETLPVLSAARKRDIVVICRSGNRSVLAAHVMQRMGYQQVSSLRTGLRGWNDYEQPLVTLDDGAVDIQVADEYFSVKLNPEQMAPAQ